VHKQQELAQALVGVDALGELLTACKDNYDRPDKPDCEALGRQLYEFLQEHLQLGDHLSRRRQVCVFFQSDPRWRHLPWEILHNGQGFLAANSSREFIPVRLAADEALQLPQTRNRPLHALASSPEDVAPLTMTINNAMKNCLGFGTTAGF
jgi:hypothetical protein